MQSPWAALLSLQSCCRPWHACEPAVLSSLPSYSASLHSSACVYISLYISLSRSIYIYLSRGRATLSPCTTVLSFLPFTASLPDSLPDRFPPLPRHDAPHLASIVFNPGGGNYGDYGGGFMADSSQQQGGDAGGEASSRFHSPAAFAFPRA